MNENGYVQMISNKVIEGINELNNRNKKCDGSENNFLVSSRMESPEIKGYNKLFLF